MTEGDGAELAGPRPHAVFVSCASHDAAIANSVVEALERSGLGCWIAARDVVPGELYAEAIVRAIDSATACLVVLSAHAAASPHVLREIERSVSKRHPIVSLRIDRVSMPPALEYFLNSSHWLDASASGVPAALPKLVDAVTRAMAPATNTAVGAPAVRRGEAPVATLAPVHADTDAATKSIAILPFANMSAERDQEFFSDGLAEEIINLLAQTPGLKVIARTSAFAFRGKEQDIRGIANALGVTHVLEGSVRRAGNRLRVTGQLIHAQDGTHLWSERYDRELSDIFAVQDDIAAAIVGALRMKLSVAAVSQRYAPTLPAYEAFLKARHLGAKVTPESLELARRYYDEAVALDPGFALAHVGLGYYWLSVTMFGGCPAHEGARAARAAANRALEIDPSLADAHALLGFFAAVYDLDWAVAERHFDFPMAKQASFALNRPIYAAFQFLRGNAELAIELVRHAIEADPLDVWPRMNLHAYLQAAGRENEALEQLRRVLELDEHQVVAMVSMAMICAHGGDLVQAIVIARRANSTAPWYPDATCVLAALLRRNGDIAESQQLIGQLGANGALGDARVQALYFLLCGDVERGADWVEKALAERDFPMMMYLRFVASKELRASHRWPRIAGLLNLPT